MKRLIYTAWTTLDGYLAGTDDDMSWVRGDDQMSHYEIGVVSNADTLMLGRRTYEDFHGYWSKVPDSAEAPDWEKTYAEKLNALDKVVVSTSMKDAPWERSTIIADLEPETVEGVKQGSGEIVMYGSASVLQELVNNGLVDELQLLVHPVLVGGGRLLFEGIDERTDFDLVEAKQFSSGVTQLTLRPR